MKRATRQALALCGALCVHVASPVGVQAQVSDEVADPAIVSLEARLGNGLSMSGGDGRAFWRRSPVTFTALAEMAIATDPWTTLYGGVLIEGDDRANAGVTMGVRTMPGGGLFRAGAGLVAVVAPDTAYGPSATFGRCVGAGTRLCLDLQGTLFVGGSDLPDDRIALQLQLVAGIAIDAW